METLIYGGSFNPPTRAHETIIEQCLQRDDVDEVWVMPSGERTDKQFRLSDTDRLWMLSYMHEDTFDWDERVVISRFELENLPRPTETWRTAEALQQAYPDRDFRFVFGADSVATMPDWENGEQLRQNLAMLVIPRCGVEIEETPNIEVLPSIELDTVSSSEVRERIVERRPITSLVCDAVARYITDCNLYRAAAV